MPRIYRTLFIVIAAAFLLPGAASAQSVWVEPVDQRAGFRIEFHHPVFDSPYYETTALSGIWTMDATLDAGPGRHLIVEVPYARVAVDSPYSTGSSSSTLGNLYLGMTHRNPGSPFRTLVGGRLPTVADSEAATFLALASDSVDRYEAFFPHIASLLVGVEYRPKRTEGFGLRGRVAPVLWIDTADDYESVLEDGIEIWITYHAQAVLATNDVTVGAGLSGRWLFTEDGEDFEDRNVLEAGVFLNLELGLWRPTVRLQIPLDDDVKEFLDPSLVIGIGRNAPLH